MMEFKKDRIIDSILRREPSNINYPLKDLALKYYDTIEPIINDLAQKCTGGEEVSLTFPAGKVTIKLR